MEVPMIVLAGTIAFDPERSDDMLAAVATVVATVWCCYRGQLYR